MTDYINSMFHNYKHAAQAAYFLKNHLKLSPRVGKAKHSCATI